MNNNSQGNISHEADILESSRRRRTPSRYATSIKELTKMHSRSSKKQRSGSSNEDESPVNSNNAGDRNNGIYCVLPGKVRRVKLSVIIRKPPKVIHKPKKLMSSVSIKEIQKNKEKETTQKNNNNSLLDTLLQVVQKIQDDESQNDKQDVNNNASMVPNSQPEPRREYKIRKEKEEEQKYLRYYEKYQGIVEKLQDWERELVLI